MASAGPYASLHLAPDKITMPAPLHSVFYRPDALPVAQPTSSKHWRHTVSYHSKPVGFTFTLDELNWLHYWAASHAQSAKMRPVVTTVPWSLYVCLSVGHNCAPYRNRWTNRDVIWMWTPVGPRNPVLGVVSDPSRGGGMSWPTVKYREQPAWVKVIQLVAATMQPFTIRCQYCSNL